MQQIQIPKLRKTNTLVSINKVDRNLPNKSVKRIYESGAKLLGIITNSRKKDKYNSDSNYYGAYADYASVDSSEENETLKDSKKENDLPNDDKELNLEHKSKL